MPEDINLPPPAPPELLPAPPPPLNPAGENPVWTGWDVLGIFAVFFFLRIVFGFVAVGVAVNTRLGHGRQVAELVRDPRVLIPGQVVAYLFVVLFMWFMVKSHGARFLEALRWNFPYRRMIGFIFSGMVLAFLVQTVSAVLPVPKSLPIEQYFRTATGAWLMAAFGVSIAPLVEELMFRGFIYPTLTRHVGTLASVLLTSGGFAFLHEEQLAHAWAPLLLVFMVGLVLTIVRARTKSLAAGFLIHAAYNGTLFAMLWIGSDHFRHLERMSS